MLLTNCHATSAELYRPTGLLLRYKAPENFRKIAKEAAELQPSQNGKQKKIPPKPYMYTDMSN